MVDEPGALSTEPDVGRTGGLPPGIGRHRAPGRAAVGSRAAAAPVAVGRRAAGRAAADRLDLAGPAAGGARPAESTGARAGVPSHDADAASVGEAATTSATVVVSVVGPVARPGLVTLPTGSRVADAVDAAGGLLPEADPASVNLAALVSDGQQIAVGVPGVGGSAAGGPAAPGVPAAWSTSTPRRPQNSTHCRESVPSSPSGSSRTAPPGRSPSVDQLDDVPGIGPAIAAELAELVTV